MSFCNEAAKVTRATVYYSLTLECYRYIVYNNFPRNTQRTRQLYKNWYPLSVWDGSRNNKYLYCGWPAIVKTHNLRAGIKGSSLQVITEIHNMQNSPMKVDILSMRHIPDHHQISGYTAIVKTQNLWAGTRGISFQSLLKWDQRHSQQPNKHSFQAIQHNAYVLYFKHTFTGDIYSHVHTNALTAG